MEKIQSTTIMVVVVVVVMEAAHDRLSPYFQHFRYVKSTDFSPSRLTRL
jgi:hypothetical protein